CQHVAKIGVRGKLVRNLERHRFGGDGRRGQQHGAPAADCRQHQATKVSNHYKHYKFSSKGVKSNFHIATGFPVGQEKDDGIAMVEDLAVDALLARRRV
ncbi:MAG: hypothetical protein ACREUK_12615, partial [Burkholderiales bacterium]